ncbi:EI24 domain-containing protein [Undibacterium luofuense]|nr:EI24 domain-containing protein [Undibacterium luofuense]
MNMTALGLSWGRALGSQFHWRMLSLTFLPFLAAAILWAGILWFGLQALVDLIQAWFSQYQGFEQTGRIFSFVGLLALKAFVVPLVAMWLLLPLMVLTSMICITAFAMPSITRFVGSRYYPVLERRHGGSLFGSLWHSLSSFVIFIVIWLLTLPLTLIPPLAMILQPLLWGWLTYRVMIYDALAEHADADERELIITRYRPALIAIGTVSGLFGAAPGMLWLGGVMNFLTLPFTAGFAIWLYIVVFVFTGLWFVHFSLSALEQLRAEQGIRIADNQVVAEF